MNKQELLKSIAENVQRKHPWKISQEKYEKFFGELPREYLSERQSYDNLLEKSKQFKLLHLVLSEVKVEIRLNLDQCIEWELGRWDEARAHNIVPGDIKKILKGGDMTTKIRSVLTAVRATGTTTMPSSDEDPRGR